MSLERNTLDIKKMPTRIESHCGVTNIERAADAAIALEAHIKATGTQGEDNQTCISDLLCNLKHYCNEENISFESALKNAAKMNYEEVMLDNYDEIDMTDDTVEVVLTECDSDSEKWIGLATEKYASDDINIDSNAEVSIGDDGAWIQAWVFVTN